MADDRERRRGWVSPRRRAPRAGAWLLAVAAGVGIAGAHPVTLDGNLADWCFNSLPVGSADTFRRVEPPTCALGRESIWYDGQNDTLGTNDLAIVGMTSDATNLYFGGKLYNAIVASAVPHFQIALGIVPGGNTTWWDPLNMLTNRQIGQRVNPVIQPDYLIVIDAGLAYLGQNGAAVFESFSSPGTWTIINPQYRIGFNLSTSSLEVGVPWSAFACAACPPFGPSTAFRYTFMVARGNLSAPWFTPKGPIDDVVTEQVAGTYTTSPQSCVPGPVKTTTCELSDTSSDAFLLSTAASGRVPATLPGTPLTIAKGPGSQITLGWGASCMSSDTDYEVYDGPIGSFAAHAPVACSTAGSTSWSLTPAAGDRYYLVVPTNGAFEGSYGKDRLGNERPQSTAPCRARLVGACAP